MTNIPNFRLDPCYACKKRYDITDINNINSCVVETAAAFAGESSLNAIIGTPPGDAAAKCLEESKHALGKSGCVLRLTNSPVWTQTPHFFPYLFSQTGNKADSLNKCIEECKSSTYPRECTIKCQTDADAVIIGEKFGYRGRSAKQAGMQNFEVVESEMEKHNKRKSVLVEGFNNKCAGDNCRHSQRYNYLIWFIVFIVAVVSVIVFFMKK